MATTRITVRKLDAHGREVWRYPGLVRERGESHVLIEARFSKERVDLGYVVFEKGDRFFEWFYSDRWYNVFEVRSVRDGELKGWYCNITRPAAIDETEISAIDLELDFWFDRNGAVTVLDQEEYDALDLSDAERHQVSIAVDELRALAASKSGPFASPVD